MRTYMPTWAEIDLDKIVHNYKTLKALTREGTKMCAMIKANAYGHGSVEIAKHLEKEGCDYFGVATASEALELRQAGVQKPIMCLAYVEESLYEELLEKDIEFPIFSWERAKKLSDIALKLNKDAKIHIKLDTGMSRVGFATGGKTVEEIERISQLPRLVLQGIFTHFALADTRDRAETDLQYRRYSEIVEALEARGIHFAIKHVCNSAGMMQYPEYHLDMVRIGIALYGHYPSEEVDKAIAELRPAMTLKTRITHVKLLEEGRGVSYGHRYRLESGSEYIATVPLGYADGLTRRLSGQVQLFIHQKGYDQVGSICMDQCMLRVDETVQAGDEVIVFSGSEEMAVERFAQILGSINYEMLCMVQRRIPRVYKIEGEGTKTVNYLLD